MAAEHEHGASATGKHVLLVEDNPLNQEVTSAMLREAGFQVTVAGSGGEAISCAEQETYSAVLMDLSLPDMNGMDVAKAMRANPRLSGLPIIGLSGKVGREVVDECLGSGIDDFLVKPCRLAMLVEKLNTWIAKCPVDSGTTS